MSRASSFSPVRTPRALALLLCLLASACGGDGKNAAEKAQETTTTTATKEQDEAFAKRIVLTVADLPAGFAEVKDAAPDDPTEEDPFDKCMDPQLGAEADAADKAVRGEADSPDFEKEDGNQLLFVGASATVFDTEANAEKAMGLVGSEQFKTCVDQILRQEIEKELAKDASGAKVTRATAASLSFGQHGEQTIAFRFDLQLRAARQSFPAPFDLAFIRKDRAVAILSFGSLGTPFPPGDEQSIASKVVARM